MALAPQSRIGSYEILEGIGAGGMGEVYRARDTKLGREVAIKVLPAAFTGDAERMARFQREAHLLAALNHPGIATIHGLEESDAQRALVMELVPGPTLAERIAQGALALEEALPLARQIAEALEYAHEHGIVHRDLKPANVKLTGDGTVKLLDFGLAKALSDDTVSAEVSHSPTLSGMATRAGVILGTAAYMSPEQAKGKAVDRRSDIWSFGVVLYEMLSGKRMFTGETAAETLASVLKTEPDWGALSAEIPPSLKRLLRRCLEKDTRRRVQAIGEARIAIEDALGGVPAEAAAAVVSAARLWPHALALAGAAAVGAGLMLWAPWQPATEPPTPLRLSVELGADASLVTDGGAAAILSPDGKLLVFAARKAAGQKPQLYLRRLDQLAASPLAGTDDARDPFFSPDGQWIAFFAEGKLKKVPVTGGAAVTLADAPSARGGTWSENGTILFTPASVPGVGLSRVASGGGTAEVLTTPDPAAGESSHRWPQALPGGKAVLFTAGHLGLGLYDDASILVQPLPTGPKKVVHRGGYYGRYLKSGHIVYIYEGTLLAARLDPGLLEVSGPAAPVLEGLSASGNGGAQFAFSDRGTLVFLPGQGPSISVPIQWMDKEGKTEPLRAVAGNYDNLRFSPDGRRLAMDVREGRVRDVWVYDWGRETMSRLTFDPGDDSAPVWTPDGRRIAFASAPSDTPTPNLFWRRADGTGEAERLTESPNSQSPMSWHPSGKFLAFVEADPQTRADVWTLPMEGDEATAWKPGKPATFLNSPFNELFPAFSPDGRWLAYGSDESGRVEVYVRPFPGPGGKWQVSTSGGNRPTWSRNGKELLYRVPGPGLQMLMVAACAVDGESFRAERPRQWSPGLVPAVGPVTRPFDLHPDGQRAAVLKAAENQAEERRDHVVLIQNFFEELRRVAPAERSR